MAPGKVQRQGSTSKFMIREYKRTALKLLVLNIILKYQRGWWREWLRVTEELEVEVKRIRMIHLT
jgi:hypothetical protein